MSSLRLHVHFLYNSCVLSQQKAAADHLGIDGNEESFTYEDEVSPAK